MPFLAPTQTPAAASGAGGGSAHAGLQPVLAEIPEQGAVVGGSTNVTAGELEEPDVTLPAVEAELPATAAELDVPPRLAPFSTKVGFLVLLSGVGGLQVLAAALSWL
jgi:hypothetical protein